MKNLQQFFWAILFCAAFTHPAWAVPIEKVTSPGGIEAWLIADHSLPIIAMSFSFTGGNYTDPDGKSGTADFTASMLDEGAGNLSSSQFQDQLNDLATSLNFSANADYFSGGLKTVSQNRDKSFELLRLALQSPRFLPRDMERIREQMIASIKQKSSDPETQAAELWRQSFFGKHPYGQIATVASVERIRKNDLLDYMRGNFTRNHLQIGVAGDITASELSALLDQTFGFLPAGNADKPQVDFQVTDYPKQAVQHQSLAQTVAVFGHSGIKRDDPDFYAAYVLNYILGGGSFSSHLMQEIREKRGLVYSVSTNLETMRHSGTLIGSVASKKDGFAESKQMIEKIWRELPDTMTESDVEQAKQYLLGSFPLRFSSSTQIAGILLVMQQDGLGIEFLDKRNDLVRAVTFKDVKRVAKKLLQPDQLLFAIVGDVPPDTESTH